MDTKTLATARADYLLACQIEGKSRRTLQLYSAATGELLAFLEYGEVTPSEIRRYLASISEARSPVSVNIYCRALRTFFRWQIRNGYLDTDPMVDIRTPRVPTIFPYVLSEEEVSELLRVSKPNSRDYAIVLFLLDTGVRASELCGISVDDLSLATRSVKVFGKGAKERTVFFSDVTARAISRWLAARNPAPFENALFTNRRGEALTLSGLEQLVRRLGKKAGIEGKRVSPHTLRHTFATFYIKEGGDAHSLQQMLGHTTTKMSEIYVNLVGRDLAEAHRKYSPVGRITRHGKA